MLAQCPLHNISVCAPSVTATRMGQALVIVVYNPLGWRLQNVPLRIPISVGSADWSLYGAW